MTAESSASHGTTEAQEKSIVLVADDSRVMRVALTRILKDEYIVLEAEHGEDAWRKLTAETGVQMVFSDLSMPELDGFGLLERIRTSDLPRIRDVPFIVITGNEDDQGVRKQALSRGATDFILKPFQTAEIKARAKAHVDHLRKLRAASTALEQASTEDAATGLANQRFFLQRAAEALSFGTRQGLGVGLLFVQLDRWAAFVQQRGADVAGALLRDVGEELRQHVRHEDVLAHFGDGRFALLSPAATRAGSRQLARRILDAVRARKLAHQGQALSVTASIGIAVADDGGDADVDRLLERADRLLAKAIRDGGDAVLEDDYLRAHDDAPGTEAVNPPPVPVDPAVVQKLRVELAEARQLAESRQVQLEGAQSAREDAVRQLQELGEQLEAARAAGDARPQLEAEQIARRKLEQELEQLRAELQRMSGERVDLQSRIDQTEQARQAMDAQLAAAKAQAEVAQGEATRQAVELERERAARHQAESELAKLQLQEVARRETERHAAEAERERAARSVFARLLHCMRGDKR